MTAELRTNEMLTALAREIFPKARRATRARDQHLPEAGRQIAVSASGIVLLLLLCGAFAVVSWGLLIAAFLYVMSAYSMTTWLLTVFTASAVHVLLSFGCWRYAVRIARNVIIEIMKPGVPNGDI